MNCQEAPSPPLLPLLTSGIQLRGVDFGDLADFSLMERPRGLFWGAEMRRGGGFLLHLTSEKPKK